MNELQTFTYENKAVRTVLIDGEPWWVLKDVCGVLSIGNVTDVAKRLDEDEKNILDLIEYGRTYKKPIINESGLYNVILRSYKPEAKAFKRWVTHEVLPAVRKTGTYKCEEVTIDIEDVETLLKKKDWLVVLTALSKVSNEALPIFKQILDKIAPDEFFLSNITKTTVKLKVSENFAEHLKQVLRESGMSQNELAKKSGLPKSGISQYVNGKVKPNYRNLEKIKNALTFNFIKGVNNE